MTKCLQRSNCDGILCSSTASHELSCDRVKCTRVQYLGSSSATGLCQRAAPTTRRNQFDACHAEANTNTAKQGGVYRRKKRAGQPNGGRGQRKRHPWMACAMKSFCLNHRKKTDFHIRTNFSKYFDLLKIKLSCVIVLIMCFI